MLSTTLLKQNRKFSPIYGNNFSNHLSMGLVALERLGADAERLEEYFKFYLEKHQLIRLEITNESLVTQSNWKDYLGDRETLYAYVIFFNAELERLGAESLLKTYLHELMPSVGAQAFHCVIRLGYAIDANDEPEMAFALAYWAAVYWPIEVKVTADASAVDVASYLQALTVLTESIDLNPLNYQSNIEAKMKFICQQPSFFETLAQLQFKEKTTLSDIAKVLIKLYLQTNNFTVLHAVTSCHAMRLLMPFLKIPNSALQYYWHAVCAAYLIEKSPALVEPKQLNNLLEWEQIKQKTITKQDEHVIKLVYSCWCEAEHYQNPLYQQAALLKMRI